LALTTETELGVETPETELLLVELLVVLELPPPPPHPASSQVSAMTVNRIRAVRDGLWVMAVLPRTVLPCGGGSGRRGPGSICEVARLTDGGRHDSRRSWTDDGSPRAAVAAERTGSRTPSPLYAYGMRDGSPSLPLRLARFSRYGYGLRIDAERLAVSSGMFSGRRRRPCATWV